MNEPSSPASKSKAKKVISLLLKIIVTLFCFWYISTKINFGSSVKALFNANWWFLFIGVLLYAVSKLVSAFRLNINFRSIKLTLNEWDNIKLYWLGMFYNLFLPGSIGGDAYKVILLNKKLGAPYKKTSIAVLLDRFSGLLGLGIILAIYGILVFHDPLLRGLLIAGALLAVVVLYFVIRFFFKDFVGGFAITLVLGIVVQAIQVLCIYCILLSLHEPLKSEWILIFLIASSVSVFPVSMGGGLGTRELVFSEGARYFILSQELGVTISLLFFLCNLLSCIWGAYFIFRNPLSSNNSLKPNA